MLATLAPLWLTQRRQIDEQRRTIDSLRKQALRSRESSQTAVGTLSRSRSASEKILKPNIRYRSHSRVPPIPEQRKSAPLSERRRLAAVDTDQRSSSASRVHDKRDSAKRRQKHPLSHASNNNSNNSNNNNTISSSSSKESRRHSKPDKKPSARPSQPPQQSQQEVHVEVADVENQDHDEELLEPPAQPLRNSAENAFSEYEAQVEAKKQQERDEAEREKQEQERQRAQEAKKRKKKLDVGC